MKRRREGGKLHARGMSNLLHSRIAVWRGNTNELDSTVQFRDRISMYGEHVRICEPWHGHDQTAQVRSRGNDR